MSIVELAMSAGVSCVCTVLVIIALFSMERKAYGGTIGFLIESTLPSSFLGVVSAMISMTCINTANHRFYREAVASNNLTVALWLNSLVRPENIIR